MKMQAESSGLTPNTDVATSFHNSGIVLLHMASGSMYASNITGARIWRGLEERLSPEAIVNEISDEYQIGQTTAREHVYAFITELRQQKLVEGEMKQ